MNNKTCTEIENGPDQDCHPLKDSIQLNSHHSKITPKKPFQSSVKKKKLHVFIRNTSPSPPPPPFTVSTSASSRSPCRVIFIK